MPHSTAILLAESDEVFSQHFAERALRDLFSELDDPWHLVERQAITAEPDQLFLVERALRDHDRLDVLLARRLSRDADHDHLSDLRVRCEDVFQLHGVHLVARDLDEELLAPGEPEASLVVETAEIAGEEEAV